MWVKAGSPTFGPWLIWNWASVHMQLHLCERWAHMQAGEAPFVRAEGGCDHHSHRTIPSPPHAPPFKLERLGTAGSKLNIIHIEL